MTANGPDSSKSAGGTNPKAGNTASGQRPGGPSRKSPYRSAAPASRGGINPIVGWSIAFVVIAAAIVASAVLLSQPADAGTGAPVAPIVVTPASVPSSGRTLGAANASVTVDLYGDFRCTACHEFTVGGAEEQLVNDYVVPGKVRLVWKDRLIIDEIRGGTASLDAANAAFCAADQGKFWVMHDWLFANQSSSEAASAFSASRLSQIGKAAGLDMTAFQPCLDQGTHDSEIRAANTLAANTINSTPTVYVNGTAVNQPGQGVTYDMIKAAIDAALAAPAPSPSV